MADMDHGFKLAQDGQQWITEAEAWADDPSLPKNVLGHIQAAHDELSRAFVAAGFTPAQTLAIFPGAGGAHTEDGGSGGGKAPPPPK